MKALIAFLVLLVTMTKVCGQIPSSLAGHELKYETRQKEHIKVLNRQGKVQRADLQRVNLERNITIGGVILLLILAAMTYSAFRNKKRNKLELQAKQDEINQKNFTLGKLLQEKEQLLVEKDWLLKEVHHRVKNNLQIVMSLLSTQSAYLENDVALDAISASRNRVQAISLIHQKLYSTSDVASIDMQGYIADLVNYLRDCLDTAKHRIRFEQLVEPIRIDLAQAVPLGLILNEAITNAIKYAFDDQGGEIIICFQSIGNDSLLLTVADNGIGLLADFDLRKTTSLGMEMMKALVRQLRGSFDVKNASGVTVMVEFKIAEILSKSINSEDFYS